MSSCYAVSKGCLITSRGCDSHLTALTGATPGLQCHSQVLCQSFKHCDSPTSQTIKRVFVTAKSLTPEGLKERLWTTSLRPSPISTACERCTKCGRGRVDMMILLQSTRAMMPCFDQATTLLAHCCISKIAGLLSPPYPN